jgi:hypothetical protein
MGDAFRGGLGLPETPEWLAQADFAYAARAMLSAKGPESGSGEAAQKKLATLREFVSHGYKTQRMSSM